MRKKCVDILTSPSSLSILLIIRFSGSTYFCNCFHFSRYACSSPLPSLDATPADPGLPATKQLPQNHALYNNAHLLDESERMFSRFFIFIRSTSRSVDRHPTRINKQAKSHSRCPQRNRSKVRLLTTKLI